MRGHEQGLENGDITTAIGCISNMTEPVCQGDPLADIDNHLQQLSAMMQRHQMSAYRRQAIQPSGHAAWRKEWQFARSPRLADLEWQIINQSTLIAFIEHLRLQWYFWSEQLIRQLHKFHKHSQRCRKRLATPCS